MSTTKEVRYDCTTRVGTIITEGEGACEPTSVILLFQRIDAKVERIEIFNDEGLANVFVRDDVNVWSSAP